MDDEQNITAVNSAEGYLKNTIVFTHLWYVALVYIPCRDSKTTIAPVVVFFSIRKSRTIR